MINLNNTEHQLDLDTSTLTIEQPSQQPTQKNQCFPSQCEKKCKLKNETIFKLVDHSVGNIALECGYHLAHQSSLDILTDVCCDYFKKIATLLRTAYDTEDWRDTDSDFVDSLERVFHQINIPSAANLHQFICKMQAIKKHQTKQSQQTTTTTTASNNSNNSNHHQVAPEDHQHHQ